MKTMGGAGAADVRANRNSYGGGGGGAAGAAGGSFAQRQQGPSRGGTPSQAPALGKPSHVPSPPPAQSAWGRARDSGANVSAATPAATAGRGPQPRGPPQQATTGVEAPAFASSEAKEFLKKNYLDALASDTEGAARWKPEQGSSRRASSAWGAKPQQMAGGQDFWVHLAKQIAAREQGGAGG